MTNFLWLARDRREILQLALAGGALGAFSATPFAALAQTMAGEKMKIATIGAGREGGALGTLFAKAGHPVMFSSRKPEELKDLVASAGPMARAGTVAEAVEFGDVVFLVVPYAAIEQIGKDHGKALAGKQLVIDVSNPIARRDGDDLVKSVEQQGGAGLVTAKLIPGVHLVRAFNAINFAALAKDANRAGDPVGIPIAGDDQKAIELASRLIKEIGFEPVLVGGLDKGKYLVPGTPLGGEHTPAEIREIAGKLA
ncbi:MAG: NADPH-dependent F420 reductase [Hyphomicrobiales bacterium]|nr:NADPH-dependent F420 reductase [Hyphomicrobiales bacterium]MBV9430760.1 NADPH-dependent F420 reductase [Hyphomicrobiales bacterium]MBV9738978.1 NADPH-dependent F420 reductase [Hyphomicrobiales bacterium]